MSENQYISPENFYEQYQTAQPERTHTVQLDELCWDVFNSDNGRKLLEIFKERFIMPGTPSQINDNYDKACMYYEGFREAFRQIIGSVQGYQIRKDEEARKAAGVA